MQVRRPPAGRLAPRLVALVALLAVGGCSSGPPTAGRHASPSPSASASPSPSGSLKPVLRGLLDREAAPAAGYASTFGGFVVNVHWADLQPVRGGPIVTPNAISEAIAEVKDLDAQGDHLGFKIRLYAGIYAPPWAKSMDGPPVPVRDPTSGATGTIGRFWTEDFSRAYADLEKKLAALYDGVPEVREVTISQCTTIYAEPFIRDASDPTTVAGLLQAGFTTTADSRCLADEVQAHEAWKHTRSDLSFNPYQVLDPAGGGRPSEAVTETVMSYCRQVLGPRCVLENNSIRVPPQAAYVPMYTAMSALGPPIAFQTATIRKVGNLLETISYAASLGATSVEVPSGYTDYPPAQLKDAASGLMTNHSP
ncbi:MAG: hypothetical protein ACREPI_03680 [Candidatus Dormibacterales bacterium]